MPKLPGSKNQSLNEPQGVAPAVSGAQPTPGDDLDLHDPCSVAAVVKNLLARGVEPDALDELVYDLKDTECVEELNKTDDEDAQDTLLATSDLDASAINNGGLEAQVAYILEQLGGVAGVETIEQALRD